VCSTVGSEPRAPGCEWFKDIVILTHTECALFTRRWGDRTPHESLPVKAPENDPMATHAYRQFFRLVVGSISVWYSKHNTPNPLGMLPDAPISNEDKFAI
jgi:hypothetical protein